MLQPQRFYKIDIRSNVLRQVIFTDFNIACICIVLIFAAAFYLLRNQAFALKFFLALIISGSILLLVSTKVDNQKIYHVIPRAIKFMFKKKNVRL